MGLDIAIIFVSCCAFFTFIVMQILILRFTSQKNVINSLSRLMISSLIITLLVFVNYEYYSFEDNLLIIILVIPNYILMVYLYSLYIFGVYESSIRIRLIREIDNYRLSGVLFVDLLEHYNDEEIIRKRIARLISSGEIKSINDKYIINNKCGIFSIQVIVINYLKKLLSNNNINQ
jgi:hypothetical protein